MNKHSVIKVGLAGFGNAAKIMHAPFLAVNKNFEVVSVLERHKEESKKLFPENKIVRSFEELLKTEASLIIITTPNETHFDYAKKSLLAGKDVVLEKPFTISSDEALELIGVANAEKRILSVYQNRRYASDFLTVKKILSKRSLGDVHEYEAHFDRFRNEPKTGKAWREQDIAGSGITYDLGSHLIDQALYLFGLPKNIYADIRKQRSFAMVDDYFDIQLDYGFLKVVLRSGMLVKENGPKFFINGTTGTFIKHGEDVQEEKLKAGEMPQGKDWGMEDETMFGLLHNENGKEIYPSEKGNFGMFYENLFETIIHSKPLKEKAEHGYNTIRLIELAFESSTMKKMIACDKLLDVSY